MVQSDLPQFIDNDTVKKLSRWMKSKLETKDDSGKFDIEKMIHNATYNIGDALIEANGLVFQEQLKYDEMEGKYKEARAEKFDAMMNQRLKYEKTKDSVDLMLDGEASISAQKTALNKQKHYIENLKAFAEQVRYYPKNIDTIIQLHTIAIEAGKKGLI